MYERERKERSLKTVFLPHRETFSGIFIQGICISSWPLKVHLRAVWFVKMYIKYSDNGGHFVKIMKDANVTRFWPLCTICKAKCTRHSVKVYTTNILYIFTWISFVCLCSKREHIHVTRSGCVVESRPKIAQGSQRVESPGAVRLALRV